MDKCTLTLDCSCCKGVDILVPSDIGVISGLSCFVVASATLADFAVFIGKGVSLFPKQHAIISITTSSFQLSIKVIKNCFGFAFL